MLDVRCKIRKVDCPCLEGPGILENVCVYFQYSLKWGGVTVSLWGCWEDSMWKCIKYTLQELQSPACCEISVREVKGSRRSRVGQMGN